MLNIENRTPNTNFNLQKPALSQTQRNILDRVRRQRKRIEQGKVRACDIPPDIVRDMHELRSNLGMSLQKIAVVYGLTRFKVAHALEIFQQNQ